MHAEPSGDPREVQGERDSGAVGVAHDDRQEPDEALARMTRQLHTVDGEDRLAKPLAEPAQAVDGLGTLGAGEVVGGGHAHRPGDVLRARPAVPLLGAALLLGEDVRAPSDP